MSLRRCHDCDDWSRCVGYPYFTPGDIRFCYHQVLWLVSARESLKSMAWPGEPSGYIDQPSKPQPKSHAAFEDTSIVAVPFLKRWAMVESCRAGRRHAAQLEVELRQNRGFNQLSWEARQVVYYLLKPRKEIYRLWLKGRKK
jgi:hypothetical protein